METSPSCRPARRRLSPKLGWIVLSVLCCSFAGARHAGAQIDMDIKVSRRAYILYEPIIATVSITNLAGRDLMFEDSGGKQWFNVEVTTLDEQLLQPYDPDYKLQPLLVPAGETVKRQIDLTPLFPIRDQGTHRIRANVYLAEADRFYRSNYATFDLTDGKLIWRQVVGVPNGTALRQMSLLTFQLTDRQNLYARVRDQDGNSVYTTQSLGRLIQSGRMPEQMLDRDNTLHVLHEAMPNAFLYTQISVDGVRLLQKAYTKLGTSRPTLAKTADGSVGVRGGQVQVATALAIGGGRPAAGPKLSDRPAAMPKGAGTQGQDVMR